jgi:hypothetical protein
VETLTEMIQGPCRENQVSLIGAKVIDNCRDLISNFIREEDLAIRGFDASNDDDVDELKQKAAKLLLSCIEGAPDKNIMMRMAASLDDFKIIFCRMQLVYEKFLIEELDMNPETTKME